MRLDRAFAAAAALPVAAALLGLHPALRGGGGLAETGRGLSSAAADWLRGVAALGAWDAGAPAAVAVLAASVLVASAVGLARLSGASVRSPADPRDRGRVLAAAGTLVGHVAGSGVALVGLGGAPLLFAVAGLGSILAGLRAPRDAGVIASPVPRPGSPRAGAMVLLAAAAFLVAGPADAWLQAISGKPAFPEAWYVIAVEAGDGWTRPGVVGGLLVLMGAAWRLERAFDRGGRPADLLVEAPCWALLLGPSNPFRALAVSHSLLCLRRAGVPACARAAFVVAVVLGMAAVVHVL